MIFRILKFKFPPERCQLFLQRLATFFFITVYRDLDENTKGKKEKKNTNSYQKWKNKLRYWYINILNMYKMFIPSVFFIREWVKTIFVWYMYIKQHIKTPVDTLYTQLGTVRHESLYSGKIYGPNNFAFVIILYHRSRKPFFLLHSIEFYFIFILNSLIFSTNFS